MYNYSVFAATSVGEGPSADGSFFTREDGESINAFVTATAQQLSSILSMCEKLLRCPLQCLKHLGWTMLTLLFITSL